MNNKDNDISAVNFNDTTTNENETSGYTYKDVQESLKFLTSIYGPPKEKYDKYDENKKVNVLYTPHGIQYINNLQDELGCIITIKANHVGCFMDLSRSDIEKSVRIYNFVYLYENYDELNDYCKEHMTELLDFNYMGILFSAFVVLGVPKEYLTMDKENIEDFINLFDKHLKKHNKLSRAVKYKFDFDRAMSLYTSNYVKDYGNMANSTDGVNDKGMPRISFVAKSFLDNCNVWYDLLLFNISGNAVKFITDDGNELEYILPYVIEYNKLNRQVSRNLTMFYLFYLLYINDYGCYCSEAFYKLYGETNLGLSYNNNYNNVGPRLDLYNLISHEFLNKDYLW